MRRPITRRAAARLLIAGPAAFALPKLLPAEPAARKTNVSGLSTAERRQLEKSISQLESTAKKVRKVPVPMGAEPAFVFRPIVPGK